MARSIALVNCRSLHFERASIADNILLKADAGDITELYVTHIVNCWIRKRNVGLTFERK